MRPSDYGFGCSTTEKKKTRVKLQRSGHCTILLYNFPALLPGLKKKHPGFRVFSMYAWRIPFRNRVNLTHPKFLVSPQFQL